MKMTRRQRRDEIIDVRLKRGVNFHVAYDAANNEWPLDTMMVVLLSDIRDELHTINMILGCPRFTEIPTHLEQIAKQTKKRART